MNPQVLEISKRRKKQRLANYLALDLNEAKELNFTSFEVFVPDDKWYLIYNHMSFSDEENAFDIYLKIKQGILPKDEDIKVSEELQKKYEEYILDIEDKEKLIEISSRKKKWLLTFSVLILLMGVSAYLLISLLK